MLSCISLDVLFAFMAFLLFSLQDTSKIILSFTRQKIETVITEILTSLEMKDWHSFDKFFKKLDPQKPYTHFFRFKRYQEDTEKLRDAQFAYLA